MGVDSGEAMMAYVEALQLTGTQLVSFVDLQCRFDGELVRRLVFTSVTQTKGNLPKLAESSFLGHSRTLTALATPLLPILVLFSCSCLEICSLGTGAPFFRDAA